MLNWELMIYITFFDFICNAFLLDENLPCGNKKNGVLPYARLPFIIKTTFSFVNTFVHFDDLISLTLVTSESCNKFKLLAIRSMPFSVAQTARTVTCTCKNKWMSFFPYYVQVKYLTFSSLRISNKIEMRLLLNQRWLTANYN